MRTFHLKKEDRFYRVARPVFSFVFRVLFHPTRQNIEAIPLEGPAVLAGNHKHAYDPILVDCCTKRVVHTLAKKDLHDGHMGWFFRAAGTIPVDTRAKSNHGALDTAVSCLQKSYLINVSPEGKRNYTDQLLLPFKKGAVVMANRSQCPIIPYAITGDYKLLNRNLKITYGKPIDVSELSVEDANARLYNAIKELLLADMADEEIAQKAIL